MEMHAVIGGKCIREIESQLGRSNFLQMAREIAFCHHERWDGRGYPKGLAGEEIPLSAPPSWPWPTSMNCAGHAASLQAAYPHGTCVETIPGGGGKTVRSRGCGRVPGGGSGVSRYCPALPRRGRSGTRRPTTCPPRKVEVSAVAAETPADDNLSVAMTLLDAYNDWEPYHDAQEV